MSNKMTNKQFYAFILKVSLPLVFQNVLMQSLDFIDQIMISSLGTEEIAAIGVCTKVVSIFLSSLYGAGSACMFFMTQYNGKNDIVGYRNIYGISLTFCGVSGIIMAMIAFVFPEQILSLFADDPVVIECGVKYFKTVGFAYICNGISFPISFAMRSIGRVKSILGIAIISVLSNTLFNYTLIFGMFGFPCLGIKGAAIGTTLSRCLELLCYLFLIYSGKNKKLYLKLDLFKFKLESFIGFIKKCLPLVFNEIMWQLGFVVYYIIYGKRGTEALAAITIMSTLLMISKLFIGGFSGASQILIGPEIGKNNMELVDKYVKKFIRLSWIAGFVAAGLVLLMLNPVQVLYQISGTLTGQYVYNCTLILALYAVLNAYPSMSIEGFFRVGGDNKFIAKIDMGSVWIVGVVFTFITSYLFNLPISIVYLSVIFTEIFKFPFVYKRLKSKKWINFA